MLLLKLTLAPTLVAGVTLAGRRWGARIAGVLAGLPVVAGPILLFVALDEGAGFAAHAAVSALVGLLAPIAFCLVHAWSARRLSWPVTIALAGAVAVTTTALVGQLAIGTAAAIALALAALSLAIRAMPTTTATQPVARPPWWDLPLRMLVTATLVVTITVSARLLGPRWTGTLTPFPIATSVLAVFAHAQTGSSARLLHGLMSGLYGLVGFATLIAMTVARWGIAPSFALGFVVAVAINALLIVRAR
jgi:hypothetical protein